MHALKVTFCLTVICATAGCRSDAAQPAKSAASAPPQEVEVLTVKATPVRDTGEYLGSIISRKNVEVLPQVAGYVRRIMVRPGQKVRAGDALLEIDAREETAALESAEAQQRAVKSNLDLARQTLSRTRSLYQEGLVSAQELEQAQAAAEHAEAQARSAAAQVSQRAVQLQYYRVRAPFAGTMGDVVVRIGDFVNASTVLTRVAQADVLEVGVSVPAERARMLRPGAPIEMLASDGRILLKSTIYFIAPQADPSTQLVEVRSAFQNTAGLRPREILRTRIVYGERRALQVPLLAVTRQSGQAFVFAVRREGKQLVVSRRPVTLGPLGEQLVVVEGGLSEGDRVAVSSLQALRDNAPIRPKPVPITAETDTPAPPRQTAVTPKVHKAEGAAQARHSAD